MTLPITETEHAPIATAQAVIAGGVQASEITVPVTEDLTQSAEVKAAQSQLASLAAQADEITRLAEDHAAENPEATADAALARAARDEAVNGQRAIKAAAERGDRSATANAIQRSLRNAGNATANAADIVQEHDHPATGSTSSRSAQAAVQQQKTAAKRAAEQRMDQAIQERAVARQSAAAQLQRHADGDDDDGIVNLDRVTERQLRNTSAERVSVHAGERRRNARTRRFGVERDDDGIGATRTVRGAASTTRSTLNSAANAVGLIEERGYETAEDLEVQVAGARTEEEYQYVRNERLDAYARRFGGRTFLGQEIDAALPALNRTSEGRRIIAGNWISNGMSTSQVVDRLRENGYIQGNGGWNPLSNETNSQWSHAAVQRIDRNNDDQLSAAEIAYAMAHRYGVRAAPATPAATNARSADDRADITRDNAARATPLGRQINAALAAMQNASDRRLFDTDRDGNVELHEVVDRMRNAGVTAIHDTGARGITRADVAHTWNTRNQPHRH